VKARVSPATGRITYWEHEALGYKFQNFGPVWALMLEPGYVFTFDGKKGLLAPEKINKLSTKRASRDYNSAVLNDLSFWAWLLAAGDTSSFRLNVSGEHLATFPDLDRPIDADGDELESEADDDRWAAVAVEQARRASIFTSFEVEPRLPFDDPPSILISAQLPTITINDMRVVPNDDVLPNSNGSEDFDELDEELEKLAEEGRQELASAVHDSEDGQDVP
jgi:hypothetical protein